MARTASLHREQVARKSYECGWSCGDPIKAGTRYVRSALPPHTEPNESDRWWTLRYHGHRFEDCPVRSRPSARAEEWVALLNRVGDRWREIVPVDGQVRGDTIRLGLDVLTRAANGRWSADRH